MAFTPETVLPFRDMHTKRGKAGSGEAQKQRVRESNPCTSLERAVS